MATIGIILCWAVVGLSVVAFIIIGVAVIAANLLNAQQDPYRTKPVTFKELIKDLK